MEQALTRRRPSAVVARLVAAATALPLLLVALEAYRVLWLGENVAFTRPDVSGGFFPRAATLVLFGAPDRVLVVPLVSLAVLAWLARARGAADRLAAGLAAVLALESALVAGLAAYLFLRTSVPDAGIDLQGERFQALGPPLTVSVVALALSALLAVLLVVAPEPHADAGADADAQADGQAAADADADGEDRRLLDSAGRLDSTGRLNSTGHLESTGHDPAQAPERTALSAPHDVLPAAERNARAPRDTGSGVTGTGNTGTGDTGTGARLSPTTPPTTRPPTTWPASTRPAPPTPPDTTAPEPAANDPYALFRRPTTPQEDAWHR